MRVWPPGYPFRGDVGPTSEVEMSAIRMSVVG